MDEWGITGIWTTQGKKDTHLSISIDEPIGVVCIEGATIHTIDTVKATLGSANVVYTDAPTLSIEISNDDKSYHFRCVEDPPLQVMAEVDKVSTVCYVYQFGLSVFVFISIPNLKKSVDPTIIKKSIQSVMSTLSGMDNNFLEHTIPVLIGSPVRLYQVVYSPGWYSQFIVDALVRRQ